MPCEEDRTTDAAWRANSEETCRIDLCDKCHHYINAIDYGMLEAPDPLLEDPRDPPS
jgi:hypothetical protein